MEFFSGVMVGLLIGVTIMCILMAIPEEEELELDIEENKEKK